MLAFWIEAFCIHIGIMCHPSGTMGSQLGTIFNFTVSGD
jgi:hypothetical protein